MYFSTLALATVISLGVVFIQGTSGELKDLSCWVCTSLLDKKCTDDGFSAENTLTVRKANCRQVQSPSITGGIPRTTPATTCLKQVVTTPSVTIVSRGCASPGDYGIKDAVNETCTTVKSLDGKSGSEITCFCKGDYCNGAESQHFASHFIIFAIGGLALKKLLWF